MSQEDNAAAPGNPPPMQSPHVSTDRTVDTSTLDSVVSDLIRPDMSDEQKALAVFSWWRRTVYHYGYPYMRPTEEETWQDPIKVINVHGYSLCGSQARVFGRILSRLFGEGSVRLIGYAEAEPGAWRLAEDPGAFIDSALLRRPGSRMGHTSMEVRYGGKWRLIDPHVQFYAYARDGSGLAGAEEMLADPTLVTRPARRVRGLMPCGDLSRVFYASTFVNWGALTRDAAPDDHTMDITLRPGETYTRWWDRRGPFRWFAEMDRRWDPAYIAPGPRHICEGENCWRHYGNGELIYRPRLTDDSYREGVVEQSGLSSPTARGLQPSRAGRTGRVTFEVNSPYMIVEARLHLAATRRTGSDVMRVWARRPDGRWRLVWEEPSCGRSRRSLDLTPWVGGQYGYQVRFEMKAARRPEHTALHSLRLHTTFILNYLALPRLLPGRNRVTVRVADPRQLRDRRLLVTYAWADREGEHEHTELVTRSPHTYPLRVAPVTTTPRENPKYMRFLRLEVR